MHVAGLAASRSAVGWKVGTALIEIVLTFVAVTLALLARPWRMVPSNAAAWSWVLLGAVIPVSWGLDLASGATLVRPLSLAPLLVLLCGWPLTILALLPIGALSAVGYGLSFPDALDRFAWLGLAPATAALFVGAATRRWLPNHLFVYLLARAWIGTFVACLAPLWFLSGLPTELVVLSTNDRLLGAALYAYGEATLTATLIAALVLSRPNLVATYSDRLYLPARSPDAAS